VDDARADRIIELLEELVRLTGAAAASGEVHTLAARYATSVAWLKDHGNTTVPPRIERQPIDPDRPVAHEPTDC
jgi:hypothetical protein